MRKLLAPRSSSPVRGLQHHRAPASPPQAPRRPAAPYGLTVEEEARILALEDRREYDPAVVGGLGDASERAASPAHRAGAGAHRAARLCRYEQQRCARRPAEKQAGVDGAGVAGHRPGPPRPRDRGLRPRRDRRSRRRVEPLLRPDHGQRRGVAAEAVEALSKLTSTAVRHSTSPATSPMTDARRGRKGVRARAVRFLFRFETRPRQRGRAATRWRSPLRAVRQEAAYSLARRAYAPARGQLAAAGDRSEPAHARLRDHGPRPHRRRRCRRAADRGARRRASVGAHERGGGARRGSRRRRRRW